VWGQVLHSPGVLLLPDVQISANLRKALGGNAKDVVDATGELSLSVALMHMPSDSWEICSIAWWWGRFACSWWMPFVGCTLLQGFLTYWVH
jgi:hypothetical protein